MTRRYLNKLNTISLTLGAEGFISDGPRSGIWSNFKKVRADESVGLEARFNEDLSEVLLIAPGTEGEWMTTKELLAECAG